MAAFAVTGGCKNMRAYWVDILAVGFFILVLSELPIDISPTPALLGAAVVIVTWRPQFASNAWRAMGVEAFSSEADTGSR
jgi:hypothetical protein